MEDDSEQGFSLDTVFTEPLRPPTPPPTFSTYQRDVAKASDGDWSSVNIRLVGDHPLWGHYLWNASRSFASYLDRNPVLYTGRNVLELGAGGGLPGLVAAKNGARHVVSTDYPDANLIENLEYNAKQNLNEKEQKSFKALGYTWGHPVDGLMQSIEGCSYDLIIMSDLVFNHSQHDALLKTSELTLSSWSSSTSDSKKGLTEPCLLVFYTHHRPHLAERDLDFFCKASTRGWACEEVVTEKYPPMFPEDPGEEEVRSTVHGWRLTRRRSKLRERESCNSDQRVT